jgi:hypothetical protein
MEENYCFTFNLCFLTSNQWLIIIFRYEYINTHAHACMTNKHRAYTSTFIFHDLGGRWVMIIYLSLLVTVRTQVADMPRLFTCTFMFV